MYSIKINDEDSEIINKELNKRIFTTFFVFMIGCIISFAFFYVLTINYIHKWYILLFDFSLIFLWIYLWLLFILITLLIKKNIKTKRFNKIQEDFTVVKKEIEVISNEGVSDSYNYFLKVISENSLEEKKLSVLYNDYVKINKKQTITITYYDKLDLIIEAKVDEFIIKKLQFITKPELNIFKVWKKYK